MKLKGSCHCQSVQFECESHSPYPYMRCYCSICRKTAGGGGYAINIMGIADTLTVQGQESISIYQAGLFPEKKEKSELSSGRRHFCKQCGSCLWVSDPNWPQLIHPFASAIDTPLPKAPETIHMMVEFAVSWCDIPDKELKYQNYPPLSIEAWHKKHELWLE
ncbi:GFA family protein [Legionella impletisoli]|uniref:Alanine acetyltransferase n=1 Tax=Legionella impletisoli TaxID=343510 RepID=A0A917JMZ0_9GAMM|nr:GFA family protein [Legionella impletisoli]GGI78072.1 alanine acetyltransferase [Legionella impletisoli]